MRKWILYLIVVSIMISVITGCSIFGGSSGSSFGGIGGIGGSGGGSGYSPARGELDTSFNGTGIVLYNESGGAVRADWGNSIYVDNTGSIYVTGHSFNINDNHDMVIWKYISNGSLDSSFGSNGIVVYENEADGNSDDYGNSIYVDNNGNIYVTGYSINSNGNKDMVIWRYNSSGSLDSSFGNNGIVLYNNGVYGHGFWGHSIYVDNTGKIYVTGRFWDGDSNDMVIWKYK
jgi:uncharacterized delta-60 repeat protein